MRLTILPSLLFCASLALSPTAGAESFEQPPQDLLTPDKVESRLGTLSFKDGFPSADTVARLNDHLLFAHAFDAYLNTYQGANMMAIREGFESIGVKDNEILVFSKLMDSRSLFLTANADTIYFVGTIDLSKGPMVFETPPKALGTIDDYWWRWVIDFGAPGPDRGYGGKYLFLPPGYDGPLPEGGFFVAHARTTKLVILGRSFMENSDPAPAVELIKATAKIYPYEPGGYGTSIATFLEGKAKLARIEEPPATVFHEGSGVSFSTVPPSGFRAFELLNELVQQEPATALDPELMGSLAAIGIVKGEAFAPDPGTKAILEEAATLADATARSLLLAPGPNHADWRYYPDSSWLNPLFVTGSEFETPIPQITRDGLQIHPPTGYRQLDARAMFFYGITGITPAMSMTLPGIGSQYLFATLDAANQPFDGGKTYKVTLPKGIPEANFWSFTVYDNQTRSMLQTPQLYPRAGSQSFPSPAAEAAADGTTTIWFAPSQPEGVARGNWIQTMPGKGWFVILRLYSPLEPFFTKAWRPSEIELVR